MVVNINKRKIMAWFYDWSPASPNEYELNRIKAYLDFDEQDIVEQLKPPYETYFYKNKLGKDVSCRILIRRENGGIVVRNENGCDVYLTEKDLFR